MFQSVLYFKGFLTDLEQKKMIISEQYYLQIIIFFLNNVLDLGCNDKHRLLTKNTIPNLTNTVAAIFGLFIIVRIKINVM